MLTTTLFVPIALSSLIAAQTYVLQDNYEPASFFDMFDFFTATDPTNGYVSYVDRTTAQNNGLISNNNGSIYMGVDSTNMASGSGRSSVRVTSKKTYNHGLIILDLAHMPGGICGTWPAFWMTGPNWPTNGEIDIIEGVNSATANCMTLHTDAGCSVFENNTTHSGSLVTPNCDVNAPGQATNAGCLIDSTTSQTFGGGFNAMGGGVYATEWTSTAISVYFFPRNAIPGDITNGNPDPSGWGPPQGMFSGGCDIDSHVVDQQIVFDTTFCGDWAGNGLFDVWYVAHDIREYYFANEFAPLDAYPLLHNIDSIRGFRLFHDLHFVYDVRSIHDFPSEHHFLPVPDDILIKNVILIFNQFIAARYRRCGECLADRVSSLVDITTTRVANDLGHTLASAIQHSAKGWSLLRIRQPVEPMEPKAARNTSFLEEKEES